MDTLQLLDKVHGFYTDSFTLLMTLTVTILVIIGGILPFVLQFIQARSFKSEKESLESLIKVEIQNARIDLQSDLDSMFANELGRIRKVLDEEIVSVKLLVKEQVDAAKAGVYHLQAISSCKQGSFGLGASDYAYAAVLYLSGKDDQNGQRAINGLIEDCLPKLRNINFESDPDLEPRIDELREELKSRNANNRFTDAIEDIEAGMATAKKRK